MRKKQIKTLHRGEPKEVIEPKCPAIQFDGRLLVSPARQEALFFGCDGSFETTLRAGNVTHYRAALGVEVAMVSVLKAPGLGLSASSSHFGSTLAKSVENHRAGAGLATNLRGCLSEWVWSG